MHRVDPNVSLVELRGEISRQLDSPSLPGSYIFLRCVGRYLCTVRLVATPLYITTCCSHSICLVGEQTTGAVPVTKALCATFGIANTPAQLSTLASYSGPLGQEDIIHEENYPCQGLCAYITHVNVFTYMRVMYFDAFLQLNNVLF